MITTEFKWQRPAALDSERLYPYGSEHGDENLLDSWSWFQWYQCEKLKLNGKVGAPYHNDRYYYIYVSVCKLGEIEMLFWYYVLYQQVYVQLTTSSVRTTDY